MLLACHKVKVCTANSSTIRYGGASLSVLVFRVWSQHYVIQTARVTVAPPGVRSIFRQLAQRVPGAKPGDQHQTRQCEFHGLDSKRRSGLQQCVDLVQAEIRVWASTVLALLTIAIGLSDVVLLDCFLKNAFEIRMRKRTVEALLFCAS